MDSPTRQLAAAQALSALPPARARAFARHLGCCPDCRAETDALREAASSLAAALPPVDPPPALRGRILAAIRSGQA